MPRTVVSYDTSTKGFLSFCQSLNVLELFCQVQVEGTALVGRLGGLTRDKLVDGQASGQRPIQLHPAPVVLEDQEVALVAELAAVSARSGLGRRRRLRTRRKKFLDRPLP